MVLLDLQKAFDTVDHPTLLMKLASIGVNAFSRQWFSSYLQGRQQLVDVGGTLSPPLPISCGVPQGSILGPLLFLIYVNDMKSAVTTKLLLYADDSAILVSGKSVLDIQTQLSVELEAVHSWLVDNKLSLHLGKTEAIIFGSRQKLCKESKLKVTCNGQEIESKTSVKYLGIDLDQKLNGEKTAKEIIQKCNAKLKFLFRYSKLMDERSRKQLASALILCRFDYACSVWYECLTEYYKTNCKFVKIKQFVYASI